MNIPTFEELEAETAGLTTVQLHELSLRLKTEVALSHARIMESKLARSTGKPVRQEDVHQMNLDDAVLRARCDHMKIIYLRRSQQRSASDHQRLMVENARLRELLAKKGGAA